MPLSRFIDVSTTGLLYPLIISGHPAQDELLDAWATITEEYSIAIGNQEQLLYLSLYKEINKLSATIEQVEIIVGFLRKVYNGKLVTRLNTLLGTCFVFDVAKPEQYDRDLDRCLSRSKGFKLNLDLKLMQFEAIKKKQEAGGEGATKEYFQSVLITLRGAEGYFIEADKITVFEYCDMIRRLNKKIADQQNEKR